MTAHDRLRTELIQVAAVAVAIVQDLLYGGSGEAAPGLSWKQTVRDLALLVREERLAQQAKWGNQHHSPELWMSILMEEVGEAAQEAVRMRVEAVLEIDGQKDDDE